MSAAQPSRREIADAVDELGWRLMLGAIYAEVQVDSLAQAAEVVALAAHTAGADGHLSVDVRADRAVFRLQSAAVGAVTGPTALRTSAHR